MFAALGPRGCAPLGTPAGGAPLHRMPYKRLRRPAGASRRGQGCRGRAPPTPCRQAWVAPVASGAVSSPLRGCGPTNPLTRPSLEKRARGRAGGLGGHCRVDGGQGSRSDRAAAALTPRNDPNAPGWWLGCFSPAACHVANAPEGRRRRSYSALLWGLGVHLSKVPMQPTPSSAADWGRWWSTKPACRFCVSSTRLVQRLSRCSGCTR